MVKHEAEGGQGRLILLRHGESVWNREDRYTGLTDVDLTTRGIEEAAVAGRRLAAAGIRPVHVLVSPLKRAFRSAVGTLDKAGYADLRKNMIIDDRLRERDYGALTGMLKKDVEHVYGLTQAQRWRRGYRDRPPAGESLCDVVEKRIGPCFEQAIRPALDRGEDVLVVAHGNSLRALMVAAGAESAENIQNVEMPANGIPLVLDVRKGQIVRKYSLDMSGPIP